MGLFYFFLFLIVFIISLIMFFIFKILFPAMKNQGFFVKSPIFSSKELHYTVHDEPVAEKSHSIATVLCSAEKQDEKKRVVPLRGQTCALINEVYGTLNSCNEACLGLGDCISVCPQEAIVIENGCAIVTELCIGCGDCVDKCPKNLIKLVDRNYAGEFKCAVAENSLTTCSECKKSKKISLIQKKGFKFWQNCYRILKIENE